MNDTKTTMKGSTGLILPRVINHFSFNMKIICVSALLLASQALAVSMKSGNVQISYNSVLESIHVSTPNSVVDFLLKGSVESKDFPNQYAAALHYSPDFYTHSLSTLYGPVTNSLDDGEATFILEADEIHENGKSVGALTSFLLPKISAGKSGVSGFNPQPNVAKLGILLTDDIHATSSRTWQQNVSFVFPSGKLSLKEKTSAYYTFTFLGGELTIAPDKPVTQFTVQNFANQASSQQVDFAIDGTSPVPLSSPITFGFWIQFTTY
jgi:hypothetical protein